jgi:hypothetical protein
MHGTDKDDRDGDARSIDGEIARLSKSLPRPAAVRPRRPAPIDPCPLYSAVGKQVVAWTGGWRSKLHFFVVFFFALHPAGLFRRTTRSITTPTTTPGNIS